MQDIRDLLSKDPTNKLELKEHPDTGVYVKDLTTSVVRSPAEIDMVLQAGKRNRVTGSTLMNQTSSRSHAIFCVTIETSEMGNDGKAHIRAGRLNMVDLAGSERQSKTGATGDRLKEAIKINQSLTALGGVISALVDGKSTHIPYRDSKLTRLLQDSLGGNAKTVMIANCGPADYNYDETLSTLRYASHAKAIKNKPKINEDPKDAMLREFQEEISRLRQRLAAEESKAKQLSSGSIMLDGREVSIPLAAPREVVERIVEVEKVRLVGVTEEEVALLRERAEAERAELLAKAASEQEVLLKAAARTEEEQRRLRFALSARAQEHSAAVAEKEMLAAQLRVMQEQLLMGGRVMDKAAAQEEELRRAQMEIEERRRQELSLARELEEANIMMEEQYASMAEEVEAKTRKLKKVWTKLQAAQAELRDAKNELAQEREDMLDTIRELNKQMKLKSLLLEEFVPSHAVERVRRCRRWVITPWPDKPSCRSSRGRCGMRRQMSGVCGGCRRREIACACGGPCPLLPPAPASCCSACRSRSPGPPLYSPWPSGSTVRMTPDSK